MKRISLRVAEPQKGSVSFFIWNMWSAWLLIDFIFAIIISTLFIRENHTPIIIFIPFLRKNYTFLIIFILFLRKNHAPIIIFILFLRKNYTFPIIFTLFLRRNGTEILKNTPSLSRNDAVPDHLIQFQLPNHPYDMLNILVNTFNFPPGFSPCHRRFSLICRIKSPLG